MKEIEVKVSVRNLNDLRKKLEESGFIFSSSVTQKDTIFTDPKTANKFDTFVSDVNFLRIREQNDRTIFTLKRPQTGELDCIEREIEFKDKGQMEDIVEYLGYVPVVTVNKSRSIAKNDKYELSLDTVEGLGDFIEVEYMADMDTDSIKAQEEIWEFISKFGLSREDEITRGYDTLVYLKTKNS